MRRSTRIAGATTIIAALLAGFYLGNPAHSIWAPKCPVYLLTGWQCGACGIQRALHLLMHGHFAAAYSCNPFLLVSVPYAGALLMAEILPEQTRDRWRHVLHDNRVVYGFVALFVFWSVWRNL